MINSSYRNKSYRFASTMDTGYKKFCRFHGFRVSLWGGLPLDYV